MRKHYYLVTANSSKPDIIQESNTILKFSGAHCNFSKLEKSDTDTYIFKIIEGKNIGNFTTVNDNLIQKGKTNRALNMLFIISLIFVNIFVFLIVIGKDILNESGELYNLSSSIVASAGFLLTTISLPKFKRLLNDYLSFGYIGNRLYLALIVSLFSVLLSAGLYKLGWYGYLCNIIGIAAIIICVVIF